MSSKRGVARKVQIAQSMRTKVHARIGPPNAPPPAPGGPARRAHECIKAFVFAGRWGEVTIAPSDASNRISAHQNARTCHHVKSSEARASRHSRGGYVAHEMCPIKKDRGRGGGPRHGSGSNRRRTMQNIPLCCFLTCWWRPREATTYNVADRGRNTGISFDSRALPIHAFPSDTFNLKF